MRERSERYLQEETKKYARMGCKRVEFKDGDFTCWDYRPIEEGDLEGLLYLTTEGRFGKLPEDEQHARELANYLSDRYS